MENEWGSKSKTRKQGPNYNCVYEDDQFLPNEEDSTYCRGKKGECTNTQPIPNPIWFVGQVPGCPKYQSSIIQKQPTTEIQAWT